MVYSQLFLNNYLLFITIILMTLSRFSQIWMLIVEHNILL